MQLAQAGSYYGPEDIAEYVGFATEYSPFIKRGPTPVASGFQYSGYNSELGLCEFVIPSVINYEMDPLTTRYDADFNLAYMLKIFYDINENYVPRVNVYYTKTFLEFFFNILLNSDQTRDFICDIVLNNVCYGIVNDEDHTQCVSDLEELATATGKLFHIDGNSQGCRGLHSAFALINPTNHCAHVSLTPLEDPKDRIKCQRSDRVSPAELFTTADLDYFINFMIENDIDPLKGMDEDCAEGNFCDEVDPIGWDIAEANRDGIPVPAEERNNRGSANNGADSDSDSDSESSSDSASAESIEGNELNNDDGNSNNKTLRFKRRKKAYDRIKVKNFFK